MKISEKDAELIFRYYSTTNLYFNSLCRETKNVFNTRLIFYTEVLCLLSYGDFTPLGNCIWKIYKETDNILREDKNLKNQIKILLKKKLQELTQVIDKGIGEEKKKIYLTTQGSLTEVIQADLSPASLFEMWYSLSSAIQSEIAP